MSNKSRQIPAKAVRRWAGLAALAALFSMSLGSAAVDIDQSPLTVRTALPPNIVLLLDDSLSMPNSVMPDEPTSTTADALISSSINGVYYNPSSTYQPPYNADGTTRYPDASFSAAPLDGFGATVATTDTANIAGYNTAYKTLNIATDQCSVFTAQLANNSLCFPPQRPAVTHTFQISTPNTLSTTLVNAVCTSPATADFSNSANLGQCVTTTYAAPTCPSGYAITAAGTSSVRCVANVQTPSCTTHGTGYSFNSATGLCQKKTTADPTCSAGARQNTGATNVTCFANPTPVCPTSSPTGTLLTADDGNLTGNQKGMCRRGNGRTTSCNAGSGTYSSTCYADPPCPTGYTLNKYTSNSTAPACELTSTTLLQCNTSGGYVADFANSANPGKCVLTETRTPTCTAPLTLVGSSCTLAPSPITPNCDTASGFTPDFTNSSGQCKKRSVTPSALVCPTTPAPPAGSTYQFVADTLGTATPKCQASTPNPPKYRSLFVYSVKESDGSYTRHYVGAPTEVTPTLPATCDGVGTNDVNYPACLANYPTPGTCTNITGSPSTNLTISEPAWTTGFPAARCHDTAEVRQNVANWFSYYRTRIMLAKSGLMNAFADLDPTIRFGFGAINGDFTRNAATQNQATSSSNGTNLPTPKTTDTSNNRPEIAMVKSFGSGASGTHKAAFWEWTRRVVAAGSTPLRASLEAAGKYYQTDQPWLTDLNNANGGKLSCRQSYTILTTDGYWNTDTTSISSYSGNLDGGPSETTVATVGRPDLVSCPSGHTLQTIDNDGHSLSNNQKGLCRKGTGKDTSSGTGCSSGSTFRSQCFINNATCPTANPAWTYNRHTSDSTPPQCERQESVSNSVTNTGPNGLQYIYVATPPYSDSYSNTLADIAMYYWLTDLKPDVGNTVGLTNNVPTSAEDPAFWQHMTTFTVGLFGQDFSLPGIAPSGTSAAQIFSWAINGGTPASFAWPPITGSGATDANKITDLVHAAVNGHGGFYAANTPEAFASGLQDALRRVTDRVGTGASLAANSTKLQSGTTTYQALYYSGKWKGDLKALEVDPNTGAIGTSQEWSVVSALPAWGSRNIKTYNPNGASAAEKFPAFNDPATLSAAQKSALGADAAAQLRVISYLRGDSTNEQRNTGGIYRTRETPMGDIVNSQPVYVGSPSSTVYAGKDFEGSDEYAGFAGDQAGRDALLWVAANDGMLHAFNTTTGTETFAFMPNAVILNGIKNLSSPAYGGNSVPHQFYNDGEITVADAYLDNEWKTVLVGTTGRGPAKAIYALDITDPAAPTLLWERAAGDGLTGSGSIGQVVGKPVIAQTGAGVWSVLVGNGYNSPNNTAALLQFELGAGTLTVHQAGTAVNNGLAPPAVWIATASNAISTQAYAGDLRGTVWSFDLSDSDSDGAPLFATQSTNQPITGGMLAGKDPATGNVWIFFGTGRYLTQDDLELDTMQTWYGLIVQAGAGEPTNLVSNLANGRSALIERTILDETAPNASADPPTLGAREIEEEEAGDMDGASGWYMDLKVGTSLRGERMVTPNQFQANLLLGTSRIPGEGSDPCNPSGDGWIMAINPFTGGAPSSLFFDLDGDGEFTDDDKINGAITAGIGFTSIPNNPIFVGNVMLTSFDNATTSSILTAGAAGTPQRMSWRELVEQ